MKATSRVWAEKQAKSPDPTQGALVVTNLTASTRDRSKLQPWLSVSSPLPPNTDQKGTVCDAGILSSHFGYYIFSLVNSIILFGSFPNLTCHCL